MSRVLKFGFNTVVMRSDTRTVQALRLPAKIRASQTSRSSCAGVARTSLGMGVREK